ncbi:autotransporter outer membrane beta-barrel domain-containing protein [Erwinia sp. E_sp_B01_3]|uniref:autotransporter outer membrane beta-barrel domain-containing protein n=2 Tax=unclassified Erwinia TaxID=2622719 RepID=UPI0030CC0D86
MKKNSFSLSAVALSVLFGLSATAMTANAASVAVPDVSALSKDAKGQYSGGGSVFIGGSDLAWASEVVSGTSWETINTRTAGFDALVRSSGYLAYLNGNAATLGFDPNYLIEENYERAVHGQRLASTLTEAGYSRPVGVVQGLRMGTADQRYTKNQSVTFYQRDASGNIEYQKDAGGAYVLDKLDHKIPLTVSSTIALDRNSDIYIRTADDRGGEVGLLDAALYSKVKSFRTDVVAAVTATGNLHENSWNGHARDVLSVKNSIINNTLTEDASIINPANENNGDEEQIYSEVPFAVGMSISHTGMSWQTDVANDRTGYSTSTNVVPSAANVLLDNVQITAQNLAAVRSDDHTYNNQTLYGRLADNRSTALQISGSGLFVSLANSTLTGGVNGAGKSLTLGGHAIRTDISNSILKGNITLEHDGYTPVITVAVKRDTNGNYVAVAAATGTAGASALDRSHNGISLNVANSVIDGDITASGVHGFEVQLVDVTNEKSLGNISPTAHPTAQAIYNNAVASLEQTVLTNASNAWTPTDVALDRSVLNGGITGTTAVVNPVSHAHNSGVRVITWNPDLTMKNGAVWNAAATAESSGTEVKVSNLHDFDLSASTLNLVNLNAENATLGDKNRYEELSTARVVVHNDLTQSKDANGNYLTSQINVGKSVVEPLLDLGGSYNWGSLQVKGRSAGNYLLNIANSGVEPYVKKGYLADSSVDSESHSFVNYKNANSNALFFGKTELGVYQYIVSDEYDDTQHGERNVYFKRNGHLSNSAAVALSLPAAQANIATQESDALAKHLNASRSSKDDGGVWISYFGGKNENRVSEGAEYDLKTQGVMLGVDSRFDSAKSGSWLAGLAFSSARSNLSVMNSSGDLDSYGAQFYLSRRFNNGVFVDTQGQFDHFSNSASVHMLDGGKGHAEVSGNGYGLGMKVGYTWEQQGFFAEPYVKATARAFDGADYTLSNGMVVNGNDYKSMQGELGVDLGLTLDINAGYVKPYVHLAGINEFADNNKTRVNNVTLNNSIDGAAVQIGVGTEVKLFENLGGYVAFDYTKGHDAERPWQTNVGVNYSW